MRYVVYVNVTWQAILSCRSPKHLLKLATTPSLDLNSGPSSDFGSSHEFSENRRTIAESSIELVC